MSRSFPLLLSLTILSFPVYSQSAAAPQIVRIGNAASYVAPLAPGSLVSIIGANLTTEPRPVQAVTSPWPTLLGGTQVTINGVPAPLLYVSATIINAQVPTSIPTTEGSLSSVPVSVTISNGLHAESSFSTFSFGPGLFTSDMSGCGPAAALNITPGGQVTINSPQNSAAPGDYISLFGTGLGTTPNRPPSGVPPTTATSFTAPGQVIFDDPSRTIAPTYSGLAPTLVGVDQINFRIPTDAREGCAVPITFQASSKILSQTATLSIRKSRGQCQDPPSSSFGTVTMEKERVSSAAATLLAEHLFASFPSAPGLTAPPLPSQLPTGHSNFWVPAPSLRSCTPSNYSELSAGILSLKLRDSITAISIPPASTFDSGGGYMQALQSGFIHEGTYELSSDGNASNKVNLSDSFTVGKEIAIQTPLGPETILHPDVTRTITWTGGDPDSIVHITLLQDPNLVASPRSDWYALASTGSVNIAFCDGSGICSYGIPFSYVGTHARMIIEVLPANGAALINTHVPGISTEVRFGWVYRYAFDDLVIAPPTGPFPR